MASACTYHGIIGIQNAARYILDPKKTFWQMEGFVPVSPDPEDGVGDLPAAVFTFGGRNAPPENGIYFVNARIVTTTVNNSTSLELYCVDDLQRIDGARAIPTVILVGKVSKGSSGLVDTRGFDVDIMQYGIMPQQLARLRCFYPDDHPRLSKTPVPTAEKHVIVQGCITELDDNRCVISVHDITLGPSTAVADRRRHAEAVPPTKLKSFNWGGGKGKKSQRAAHGDSDRESEPPPEPSRSKAKKRKQESVQQTVVEYIQDTAGEKSEPEASSSTKID